MANKKRTAAWVIRRRAKGRTGRKTKGEPNKLESAYMAYLDILQSAGEIIAWQFERVTFTLTLARPATGGEPATRAHTYTPDFLVMMADNRIEFHDTKGFLDQKDYDKMKIAAEQSPWFRFVIVKKNGSSWNLREV